MVDRTRNKDEEINKAILEWLQNKNYTNAYNSFLQDTKLNAEDATKNNALEKRWSTILTLQKKISDLECQNKQFKEDLDRAGSGIGPDVFKRENESMV
jgi:cell shape-determining protein MreC